MGNKLYLCVGALLCGFPLGPKRQNKDKEFFFNTQVVGEILLPYICVDALLCGGDYISPPFLPLPIKVFVHNVHGVVDDIHT